MATENSPTPFALTGPNAELITSILMSSFHVTSVIACDINGRVLLANPVAASGLRHLDGSSPINKTLRELAPIEWADERMELINIAIERQRKIYISEILAGSRLVTTVLPVKLDQEHDHGDIPANENGEHWIILMTVEAASPLMLEWLREKFPAEDIFEAQVIDLGTLSILSPRELEVAALMGEGLRQKQIAERLHRSVSTVDRHRERIGEKLNITDRVELIAMAREAALKVEDARKIQVSFEQHRLQRQREQSEQ
ncbi:MAG: response regulator transcription factor [Phycisphaerales bacterium]